MEMECRWSERKFPESANRRRWLQFTPISLLKKSTYSARILTGFNVSQILTLYDKSFLNLLLLYPHIHLNTSVRHQNVISWSLALNFYSKSIISVFIIERAFLVEGNTQEP